MGLGDPIISGDVGEKGAGSLLVPRIHSVSLGQSPAAAWAFLQRPNPIEIH